MIEELDVVKLKDGTEVTILEIFDSEPKYCCQRSDDDEIVFINSQDVSEITYKCKST
ncbi:hypothetical protein [Anoxybacteroides amylolyticum]|uniref:Uncharacterized protein n=1 Tax=Anoxybacteroides amylolyticum TaxID=294699 RepID=A0A160F702_9BACL|nr:hypothetical protein [Anoxybacillus amylolyticus]ANB62326.1 hypothetical protein GFC30_3173 [Anoxybacillus amylolyticus]